MHCSSPNFNKAEDLLNKAFSLEPENRYISHSLAELAYSKSKRVVTDIEKNALKKQDNRNM